MTKLIITCDTGIDDALALIYAAAQDRAELLGVVAGFGVTSRKNAYRNSRHILSLLGCRAGVFRGSRTPLRRPGRDYEGPAGASAFHGRDGLGDTLGPVVCEEAGTGENEGVDFILEQAGRYGRDLAIVTTGPLTDMARALERDGGLGDKVGAVVCMAGALAAPGNVTEFAEANILLDCDAAKLVLESALPLTLVGLDVTRKTLLGQRDLARWKGIDTQAARLLHAAAGRYLDAYRARYPYLAGAALHDPLAVGALFHPEWFTRVPMHLTVVTEGAAEGRTCEDLRRCGDPRYTSFGALGVDAGAFEADFFARVEGRLKGPSL
ncbi:MAG: nucleoside hydrolase [Spirochaetaceae bacterium]|jgi:purine nucleosidase|nr:nucleoside hydrolase [Spirochaetaceae bacterium]